MYYMTLQVLRARYVDPFNEKLVDHLLESSSLVKGHRDNFARFLRQYTQGLAITESSFRLVESIILT